MFRELKKQPPPVRWAWAVAILVVLIILGLAGFGLYHVILALWG